MKVMLASAVKNYNKITWPKFASPKLDGIRAVVIGGVVYSRSGKPIRSKAVHNLFGHERYNNLDGELIYGSPTAEDVFNKTTSFVMSEDVPDGMSEKEITFFTFDYVNDFLQFNERRGLGPLPFSCEQRVDVGQVMLYNLQEMDAYEAQCLKEGYEGIMLRSPEGLYKHGRATEKSQDLLKVKRFVDDEAIIIGFEELLTNNNPATLNELGHQERSSCKENLVGADTLGALQCLTKARVAFNIGTGFSAELRQHVWNNREKYIGKLAKYKSFPIGVKDAPRLPVFLGFREEDDL